MLFFIPIAAAEASDALDLAELTRAVIAAHPEAKVAAATLAQARALATAAAPWPDPMVDFSLAPLSLAGMPGWQVEVRQALPIWGMRRATSEMAEADAEAAQYQFDMMLLDLAEMAAMTWASWYAVHQELDLTAATVAGLADTRATTLSRVAINRATDIDVLVIDAEIGWLRTQLGSLATQRDVLGLRINTLKAVPLDTPVPPPPKAPQGTPTAFGGPHPEVAERAAMTRAAVASQRMARVERLPMLELMAGVDTMQMMPEHRWMVGLSVEVPLDQRARAAGVDAASAALLAARAEALLAETQVAEGVVSAQRTLDGDTELLATLERDVLPAVRARAVAARSGYAAGTIEIRVLLEAERASLQAETRYAQQRALLVLRARELDLARGVLLPGGQP